MTKNKALKVKAGEKLYCAHCSTYICEAAKDLYYGDVIREYMFSFPEDHSYKYGDVFNCWHCGMSLIRDGLVEKDQLPKNI